MRLGYAPTRDDTVRWQRIFNQSSWVVYSCPKEYGGPDWTPVKRMMFLEEYRLASAPEVSSFNLLSSLQPTGYSFGNQLPTITAQSEISFPADAK